MEARPPLRLVLMLIRSLVAGMLLIPSLGAAQIPQSFEDLPLRVNLSDQLQIEDQSGAKFSGRLTRLTRGDLTIQTGAGEKDFTADSVRAASVRGHALRRGALVGAAVFAVLGAVATCSHEGGSGCAIVGPLRAAPIGAGVGLSIGALIPQMKLIYRAAEDHVPNPPSRSASGGHGSLLEDLALRVNLDDEVRVQDESGGRTNGRLTRLTDTEIAIETVAGEKRFTREVLRQVAVRHQAFRTATLIGAGAGAAYGALSECRRETHPECADGVIIGGGLGAGAGLAVGAFITRTTTVYPEAEKQTSVLPIISRGTISVHVSRRW